MRDGLKMYGLWMGSGLMVGELIMDEWIIGELGEYGESNMY
jgi:hypothetical protein